MNTLEYLKELKGSIESAISLVEAGSLREDPKSSSWPYDMIVGDFGVKAIRGRFVKKADC